MVYLEDGASVSVERIVPLTQSEEDEEKAWPRGTLSLCLTRSHLKCLETKSYRPVEVLVIVAPWHKQIESIYSSHPPRALLLVEGTQVRSILHKLLRLFTQPEWARRPHLARGIHPSAVISPLADIHEHARIGPYVVVEANAVIAEDAVVNAYCYVGAGVSIESGAYLWPRVTLLGGAVIKTDAQIGSGSVVGGPGFGLDQDGQLPHHGGVRIGKSARLGALVAVDQGTIGHTVINQHAQLDNLIQVGHNVSIGSRSVLCAQVGLSGGVELGNEVNVGGQTGFAQHVQIGRQAEIGAKSGVTRSLAPEGKYSGFPAEDHRTRLKREALLRKLTSSRECSGQSLGDRLQDRVLDYPHIHPTAQVDSSAYIHPTAVIGEDSVIGPHCCLEAYSVIGPRVTLGHSNYVSSFAVLGAQPQISDWKPKTLSPRQLVIGEYNVFREGVTVSLPSSSEKLSIGEDIGHHNLLMTQSHIGHDSVIGSQCIIANGVSIAGHVKIDHHVQLAGHVAIHQFVTIGPYAFVAANGMVSGDVPAYCLAAGDRATLRGLNVVGLRRAHFSPELRLLLRRVYRLISTKRWDALETLEDQLTATKSPHLPRVRLLIDSAKGKRRALCTFSKRS